MLQPWQLLVAVVGVLITLGVFVGLFCLADWLWRRRYYR